MHLGNVRAALINYLFALQKKGTFIVRIEDTDQTRNMDYGAQHIIADLSWLGLSYQEGPNVGGPYAPYFQSERNSFYKKYLTTLIEKNMAYPCFCSVEELDKKRQRSIALKMPPRYDRTCMALTEAERLQKITNKMPYIWRYKLPAATVKIHDLARGTIEYDLNNFSDFPLTRQDESFTFIFANFVDDMEMHISHVFRGEDHLSNTALQASLYAAFDATLPLFWHLPMLCNHEGKKLSKRDFGFSLQDLIHGGYLPEAIANYLALICGGSYEHEIMDIHELANAFNFDSINSTGHSKYDVEKLRWINHKWIERLDIPVLAERIRPFLETTYPEAQQLSQEKLTQLVTLLKTDLVTLSDAAKNFGFYFTAPTIDTELVQKYAVSHYVTFIQKYLSTHDSTAFDAAEFTASLSGYCKEHKVPAKELFALVRIALTGHSDGPTIKDLLAILSPQDVFVRLSALLQL
jgi:glutamyl-tRNA synthetase